MGRWGVGGLAFSTAFASFVNGVILMWVLRGKIGLLGGRKIGRTVVGSGLASAVMAVGAWATLRWGFGPLAVRAISAVAVGRRSIFY
jgi:peptidoglycan biosynthesis protein MviN/MurJ (putative lipid II flippase)